LGVLEWKWREFDFRSGNLRFITSAYRFHKNYKIDNACQIGHSGIRLAFCSNVDLFMHHTTADKAKMAQGLIPIFCIQGSGI